MVRCRKTGDTRPGRAAAEGTAAAAADDGDDDAGATKPLGLDTGVFWNPDPEPESAAAAGGREAAITETEEVAAAAASSPSSAGAAAATAVMFVGKVVQGALIASGVDAAGDDVTVSCSRTGEYGNLVALVDRRVRFVPGVGVRDGACCCS
ncbi:hypothetical protein Vretimale_8858 [Volvox reticuliferus]|uniref:Uncharacterized protein n=1 Tax=Volvox reticuliferus TaxID=1737510 RepID=A0A8J4LN63_9CHLO|nr:hypothetical protein Vretimale_8858 [Volvox reticuliferus]